MTLRSWTRRPATRSNVLTVALTVVLIIVMAGRYFDARREHVDHQLHKTQTTTAHNQHQDNLAICAIVDRFPEHIDKGIDQARHDANCGRPSPPRLFFGHPFPHPTVTTTAIPSSAPRPTSVASGQPSGQPTRRQQPSPSALASRRPTGPSFSPTPTPSSSPKPSPTCLVTGICLP